MASVASQLIEEVTAHAQSDSLEDAREICADGTYFPNNLRINHLHVTETLYSYTLNYLLFLQQTTHTQHNLWDTYSRLMYSTVLGRSNLFKFSSVALFMNSWTRICSSLLPVTNSQYKLVQKWIYFFYVLLTMHLSIILVIYWLIAQILVLK